MSGVDRSLVGQEFDHSVFPAVTAEQIIAYAQACGETDPRWTQPGPDLVAPPTFALSLRGRHFMPGRMPETLGRHMFDAGKDVEVGAPVVPGDVLTSRSTVYDVYEKTGRSGRMTFAVFRTAVTNQRGETVAVVDQKMMFVRGDRESG